MPSALLCGLTGEADIVRASPETIAVYCGADGIAALRKDIEVKGFDGLVSWGTCGALSPSLHVGDLLLGTRVISASGDSYLANDFWIHALVVAARQLAHARGGTWRYGCVLSQPAPAYDAIVRANLLRAYGCLAVDEEGWAVGELARKYKLPFVSVRSVSNAYGQSVPASLSSAVNADGSANMANITSALEKPGSIALSLELAMGYSEALNTLASFWNIAKGILNGYFEEA